MSKASNIKLKILYLMDIFINKTDDNHAITMNEIILELEKYGIFCERKSVYDDIEVLRHYGMDINLNSYGKKSTYFLGNRQFELPELKIIVDSIYSSKFISYEKSKFIINKLKNLTSIYEGKKFNKNIIVIDKPKTHNREIFYNIDKIQTAIFEAKRITFFYYKYNSKKELVLQNGGEPYIISPVSLLINNENYYVVAFYEKYGGVSNFRIDKMMDINILSEKAAKVDFDFSSYSEKRFGMFSGKEENVKIQFHSSLADIIIDRFGINVKIKNICKDKFIITTKIIPCAKFYSWIFSFKGQAEILEPTNVINEYKEYLKAEYEKYFSSDFKIF
jgi:predicted DNA-binding transcriptional regulator YafY